MSYKTRWYYPHELGEIAIRLNGDPSLALTGDRRVSWLALRDCQGSDGNGVPLYAGGAYGSNIEERLLNDYQLPRDVVLRVLEKGGK